MSNTALQRTPSASPPSPLSAKTLGRLAMILLGSLGITAVCMAFEPHMPQSKSERLRPGVDRLVSPVLKALKGAVSKNDWWDKTYETRFHSLIRAKGADAREARIALMAYYVGEHYGEELVCAVESDGKGGIPLLERYKQCRPASSAEPIPSRLLVESTLYGYALEGLRKGEKCEE